MQLTMASLSSLRLRAFLPVGAVATVGAVVTAGAVVPVEAGELVVVVEIGGAIGAVSVETVVSAMEKLLHLQG
jgi:hypothetical protein